MDSIFNFSGALSARTISENTRRAYYRWVDQYLVDNADNKPTRGEARLRRMERLKVLVLRRILNARRLETWLAKLAGENHSRQSLDQARASIVTLAQLLKDADHLEPVLFEQVQAIPVPSVAKNPAPDRLLNSDELKKMINASREMAVAPAAMTRNQVVVTLLCTMALRREEVSALKWGDITLTGSGRAALKVDNTLLEMPRSLLALLDRWRSMVKSTIGEPQAVSPLVRRIWKGGKIARQGLSPDGIWLIIHDAARQAGFEAVSPEDLRRSVVAGLRDSGVKIEDISRLLRHRSVLVTERFLAKLRQPEEE
jgi:integrase